MVAIKDIEMPKGCVTMIKFEGNTYVQHCPLYGVCPTRDTLLVNTRHSNCPLVEIITCKDCEYYREVDTPLGKRYIRDCNHATGCDDAKTFYCADARRRE